MLPFGVSSIRDATRHELDERRKSAGNPEKSVELLNNNEIASLKMPIFRPFSDDLWGQLPKVTGHKPTELN
jgi:hypothetical protein